MSESLSLRRAHHFMHRTPQSIQVLSPEGVLHVSKCMITVALRDCLSKKDRIEVLDQHPYKVVLTDIDEDSCRIELLQADRLVEAGVVCGSNFNVEPPGKTSALRDVGIFIAKKQQHALKHLPCPHDIISRDTRVLCPRYADRVVAGLQCFLAAFPVPPQAKPTDREMVTRLAKHGFRIFLHRNSKLVSRISQVFTCHGISSNLDRSRGYAINFLMTHRIQKPLSGEADTDTVILPHLMCALPCRDVANLASLYEELPVKSKVHPHSGACHAAIYYAFLSDVPHSLQAWVQRQNFSLRGPFILSKTAGGKMLLIADVVARDGAQWPGADEAEPAVEWDTRDINGALSNALLLSNVATCHRHVAGTVRPLLKQYVACIAARLPVQEAAVLWQSINRTCNTVALERAIL